MLIIEEKRHDRFDRILCSFHIITLKFYASVASLINVKTNAMMSTKVPYKVEATFVTNRAINIDEGRMIHKRK